MNQTENVLITGISGQMGPFMAKYLLEKGDFEVYGMIRRHARGENDQLSNLKFIYPNWKELNLVEGDLTDSASLNQCIKKVKPDYIINYASQSQVHLSWKYPISTSDTTGLGVLRLLEVVRNFNPEIKLLQLSSSEQFGNSIKSPQNEETPFEPVSPYAISKVFAHHTIKSYRESYGMNCVSAIQFNCESEIRGSEFVTRKICQEAIKIYLKEKDVIRLGNVESKRDWSYASDCIEAHWKIINQDPTLMTEYIIGSGENRSVREFAEGVFELFGLDFEEHYRVDPRFYRPIEVKNLLADSSRIRNELGWKPKVSFDRLIEIMVNAECRRQGIPEICQN